MADQKKTTPEGAKLRAFRAPDSEWSAAMARAKANGETVTDVLRRALRAYAAGK